MNSRINPYMPSGDKNSGGRPYNNLIDHQPANPTGNPTSNTFEDITSTQWDSRDFQGQNPNRSYELYDQSFDYGLDKGRWKRAYARVIHLSPNAPSFDVYLDGRLFYSGLTYRMQTDYLGVRPGNHRIIFYPSGQIRTPVFSKTVFVPRRSIVSFAVYGLYTNLDVMVVDDKTTIPQGRAKVKLVHLSPNTPAVDLLADRSVWFSQVIYQESTEYLPVTAGREILSVRISRTKQTVLTVPNVQFARNRAYTIYVIGLINASPPLQLLVALDGSGKLQVD